MALIGAMLFFIGRYENQSGTVAIKRRDKKFRYPRSVRRVRKIKR
jgi:hypothetical protein